MFKLLNGKTLKVVKGVSSQNYDHYKHRPQGLLADTSTGYPRENFNRAFQNEDPEDNHKRSKKKKLQPETLQRSEDI